MELHMRIIIFFIVMILSDSEEVKKNLTGTERGSITLPDPVMEHGFLSFGAKTIAMVNEGKITIYEDIYKNKVVWDKDTGLFNITGLQRNDSGIYNIDSKVGRVFSASYKLTVYESVPTPAVSEVNVSAESCSLLCSVKKAEETTLLWYKDEVTVNKTSSALSLPLTVHKQEFSSSYRCVAANPAENKTLPVSVTTSCSGRNNTDNTSYRKNTQSWLFLRLFLIPIVVFGNAVAVCIILTKVKRRMKREMTAPSATHSCAVFSEKPE